MEPEWDAYQQGAPMKSKPQASERAPTGNRPVHEVRFGTIRAAIWANQTEQHGVIYNVTVSRSYKNSSGDWKDSDSFGRDDLLIVAKALDEAHTWICQEQRRERQDS
jgi:hypothetical protein